MSRFKQELMKRSVTSSKLNTKQREELKQLVAVKHRDCWRVNLSNDGAAKVTPLKVFMKPDAVAKRTKARRYPKVQMDFIRNHVEELERAGCIRKNPLTRWSSPILVVPKPGKVGEY